MDRKLIAWGLRAREPVAVPGNVQRVWRNSPGSCRFSAGAARLRGGLALPRLWLFTDTIRLPDPRRAVAGLPVGRAGVVFRHDDVPDREAMGRDLARLCRARRLPMVVAGDAMLAARLRVGVHLRAGNWPGCVRTHGPITSSAHSVVELRRAARAGTMVAFLSPAFATDSHPGAKALGPVQWNALARRACWTGMTIGALGGINGRNIRRLLPRCRAIGAITALSI